MDSSFISDIRACLHFYTRLPVTPGRDAHSPPDFASVGWAAPIAGAVVGAMGGAAIVVAALLHLPTPVAAACAVAVLVVATGALHEDGLADVADGFGGGKTREAKLVIMRDSRLGSYGGIALVLAAMLRIFALAAILERGVTLALFTLVAAGALSRAAGLIPMLLLEPARTDGAGASSGSPSTYMMRRAFIVAACIGLTPWLAGSSLSHVVGAQFAAMIAALALSRMAQRQIGGYTGDVLGATQQAAEIAVMISLSAG